MKSASSLLASPLLALTLLSSGMAMAGGGYNSTSPAMGTVQLASLLCNVSADSRAQGYLRNHSLNPAASGLRPAGLCKTLALQQASDKGRQAASSRYARELSRTAGRAVRTARAPRQALASAPERTDSRDSFKQETWFIQEGGKQKRVTKHQARKQGWTGPEAMQAATQASPDVHDDGLVMAQASRPASSTETAPALVSKRSARTPSLVTACAPCDAVEEGRCVGEGQSGRPFKMMRNHGVVALPQFEPGGDSALVTADAEPQFLIKRFRTVDGTLQPDTDFSDEGLEALFIPLPVGDRVTAFTLTPDKLVVQSRPEDEDLALSRVTLVGLDEPDSADLVDAGASSGLWVKGELFRYHNNTLYTVARDEQKIFLYPDQSDSIASTASVRVVDLSAVDLSDGELVSALADGESFHIAVRKRDPESEVVQVQLYQLDEAGTVAEGMVIMEAGNRDQPWQLHMNQGKPVLFRVPSEGSAIGDLACQDSSGEELEHHRFRREMPDVSQNVPTPDLGSGINVSCVSGANFSSVIAPYILNCSSGTYYACSFNSLRTLTKIGSCLSMHVNERCNFVESWILAIQSSGGDATDCAYVGSVTCPCTNCTQEIDTRFQSGGSCLRAMPDVRRNPPDPKFFPNPCHISRSRSVNGDNTDCATDDPPTSSTIGSPSTPTSTLTSASTSTNSPTESPTKNVAYGPTGPAAMVVAASAGFGAVVLTTGFLGL